MFKIKLSIIFIVSMCLLCSCVTTGYSLKAPTWVTSTEHEYTKNNLCAIGIAYSLEEANSVAISNIGKIIKQKIESETTVVNSESLSSSGSSELSSTLNQIVKTSALIDSLVGVEIIENWKDSDGNYYSLAILNKTKTYLYYSEKISQNESIIKKEINLASTEKNKFSVYAKLQNAINLAIDNETYLDIIYAVNKASYAVTSKTVTTVNEIENIANNYANEIYITISSNGLNNQIANYFYKYFTDKGFSVNGVQSDYVLELDLKIENTKSTELFFAHYNFVANLKDINRQTIIYSYNDSGRTAHKSFEDANKKTITNLEKNLNKNFDSDFIKGMNSN